MKNRQHLTGAQAITASLRAHHVETIFGIPGVHTLSLYEALRHEAGLRHVLARHEQGAGFMAEGYARASGKVGVVTTIADFCHLLLICALLHIQRHHSRHDKNLYIHHC
ncbi:thiamine pyrophosphate-binding protein [Ktedonosporobacter rubrisoli]|uniref:Thiamine pyrophosphate-binding protein n=1 Tax=Ktedonosporobacter rubrisoli TaxID=2509675 RepID=A0A4P6JRI1_KTERU|nr:thiamine pyrophosphate-binding protein [Ktedonosporobacter rubrisoli]QBD77810.1 thiamine pyrophosphate-binding protein [Ktedonosporobacter rubrisoli]